MFLTNCKITILFCGGIINLLFDGLAYSTSGPCGARKNTTQLAKYPHVLYPKSSNKVYIHAAGDNIHLIVFSLFSVPLHAIAGR